MSIKYHDLNVGVTQGGSAEPEIVLPSAYQRVEYLDFTPHAGIYVTIPTTPTFYQVDFSNRTSGNGTYEADAFGYRAVSANDNDFEVGIYQGNQITWLRNADNGYAGFHARTAYTLNARLLLSIYLSSPRNTALVGNYQSDVDAWIGYGLDGKFYEVHGYAVTNTGEWPLSIRLIPCYRKSDNVVGVYDTVAGVFYSSRITYNHITNGTITAGPDVN